VVKRDYVTRTTVFFIVGQLDVCLMLIDVPPKRRYTTIYLQVAILTVTVGTSSHITQHFTCAEFNLKS
jgi:hypothetical protein